MDSVMNHVIRNAHLVRTIDADSRRITIVERAFSYLRSIRPCRFDRQRISRVKIVVIPLLPGAVELHVGKTALG